MSDEAALAKGAVAVSGLHLLTTGSHKVVMSQKRQALNAVLYMIPADACYTTVDWAIDRHPDALAKLVAKGIPLPPTKRAREAFPGAQFLPENTTLCPFAGACRGPCLFESGQAFFVRGYQQALPGESVHLGRLRRTLLYFKGGGTVNRGPGPEFRGLLEKDIARVIRVAKDIGFCPAIRLNGTSDLPWESSGILGKFPSTCFYDYTKVPHRMDAFLAGRLPKNYHLTFSIGGKGNQHIPSFLKRGGNVAICWERKDQMPASVRKVVFLDAHHKPVSTLDLGARYRVVDGDLDDLRFLDDRSVVVGLYAKSNTITLDRGGPQRFFVDARSNPSPARMCGQGAGCGAAYLARPY